VGWYLFVVDRNYAAEIRRKMIQSGNSHGDSTGYITSRVQYLDDTDPFSRNVLQKMKIARFF